MVVLNFPDLFRPPLPRMGPKFRDALDLPPDRLGAPTLFGVTAPTDPPELSFQAGCLREDSGIPEIDDRIGAAALDKRPEAQSQLISQLFGPKDGGFPTPEEVYYRFWKHPVSAVLMVAQVRRTKFNVSEPFLLLLTFPCVLPYGHTGALFEEKSLKARLQPAVIPLPLQGELPFIGSVKLGLRATNFESVDGGPAGLLDSTVIGMGRKAFSHVVVPGSSLGTILNDVDVESLGVTAWNTMVANALASDIIVRSGALSIDGETGVRIPVMLPLAGPLSLPPGIIGHTMLGLDGLRCLCTDGLHLSEKELSFLDDPTVATWLVAAQQHAKTMAVEVVGRQAIHKALLPLEPPRKTDAYDILFRDEECYDFWRAMEATCAYRMFFDAVIGAQKVTQRTQNFLLYLLTAHEGLYAKEVILGDRPLDVAYEILVLRPPIGTKRWDKPFCLAPWSTKGSIVPGFLSQYQVVRVNPVSYTPQPLKRIDRTVDPDFSGFPGPFKPAAPLVDPFPADDPRIAFSVNDTYYEGYERSLMTKLNRTVCSKDPDLFPDEEDDDDDDDNEEHEPGQERPDRKALIKELKCVRRGQHTEIVGTKSFKSIWSGVSPQRQKRAANSNNGGNGGQPVGPAVPPVDPFAFLKASAAKKQRLQPPTGIPPPAADDEQSGFAPTRYHPPHETPAAQAVVNVDDDAEGDHDIIDDPDSLDVPTAVAKSSSLFASPALPDTTVMVPRPSGSQYEQLVAVYRRRFPMFDSKGYPIARESRSLFPEVVTGPATVATTSTSGYNDPTTWSLHDKESKHPDAFVFWSIITLFVEPSFRGRYYQGSRKGSPVEPWARVFPGILCTGVRRDFIAASEKSLEEWVNACCSRTRREGSWVQGPRNGSLKPGAFLHRVPREILGTFRSGLWACASDLDYSTGPAKGNFTVFSLLVTRSGTATNLLPADGLGYRECIEVLHNLLFLLAIPVTQGLPSSGQPYADAIIESSVLLSALRRVIDAMASEYRTLHSTSLAAYWDTTCDAQARNGIAFYILAAIDELLSVLLGFTTPSADSKPALRLVHDDDDSGNLYAAIDPTIENMCLRSSPLCRTLQDNYITSAVIQWETQLSRRIAGLTREPPGTIQQAPVAYVESPTSTSGKSNARGKSSQNNASRPSNNSPERAPRQPANRPQARRAEVPIVRWRQNATRNLQALLQNNRPHPRFPAARDANNSNSPLICFAFCLQGHDGCKRGNCRFAHVDGRNDNVYGPNNYGSLQAFLESTNIRDQLEFTDVGSRLAARHE